MPKAINNGYVKKPMSATESLSVIYQTRIQRIEHTMKRKNIRSLRELSRITGVDLCGLSKGMNGSGCINEKNARKIEHMLKLPSLYLDGVKACEYDIPVYALDGYPKKKPIYTISKDISDDHFFIEITEEDPTACIKPGYRLLFLPSDDMFTISINDICLFKFKNKYKIGLYKGLSFMSTNVGYCASKVELVAKCLMIHL
ncbi:hypothetical protein L3V82_02280 [Thiotrichales bacterium 19S3-7]|nr:hypothetical protein [Thiotrichales bacterium 19S3-7]MCF6800994.1 hypothetical protein [Thiotrichales bacterium 19S3-11]